MNFNERNLTQAVLARIADATEPRLRQIMVSLVRHLHDFVRDVEPTEVEWLAAIEFLTATGQICNAKRQEFILLSDTLGVSMLVDAINHRFPAGATESTVFGPFYVAGAPDLPPWADIAGTARGTRCYVSGTVRDAAGAPIAGALLDVWQTDGDAGLYDVQDPAAPSYGRGRFRSDAQGRYGLRTVQPTSYPIPADGPVGRMLRKTGRHPYRPAHIHVQVSKPGWRTLTTHVFVKGDRYLDSDAVFGVKDRLIADFTPHPAGPAPDGTTSEVAFTAVEFDFVLAPDGPALAPEQPSSPTVGAES